MDEIRRAHSRSTELPIPFSICARHGQADYLAGCLMHDAHAPFPRVSDWNNMLKVNVSAPSTTS